MLKTILLNTMFFFFIGCSATSSPSIKVAKVEKNNYNKKYMYVIEEKKTFSSLHGSPFPKTNIMYFYIYTNHIKGKVQGNSILWSIGNASPKELSKNSTFIFDVTSMTIEGLENCDPSGMCFLSDLNGKYTLVPVSKLKDMGTSEKNVYSDFRFK